MHFGCPLLGGDTVSTPGPLMISITAFGAFPPGKMVHRSGAKPGDRVVVTGTIGDAALGLAVSRAEGPCRVERVVPRATFLISRYRVPQPRTALAEIVREYASAAMDVSDGLAGDLAKLCGVSGTSAVIDLDSIPLSGAAARSVVARHRRDQLHWIAGGDDYEILCTVADDRVEACAKAAKRAGVALSSIGMVVAGSASFSSLTPGQGNRAEKALLQPFLSGSRCPERLLLFRPAIAFPGISIVVAPVSNAAVPF